MPSHSTKTSPPGNNDGLITEIDESINETNRLFQARIYKVPEDLRELNKSAYIPRIIAIGPLHSGDNHLKTNMRHVKKYYADYLISRVTDQIEDDDESKDKKIELQKKCMVEMNKCVDRARGYYADKVEQLNAEMLLVDGCFILELLYSSNRTNKSKEVEKNTTYGGDSGNSKASSSVQKPIDGGEDGCELPSADPIIDNILTAKMIKQDLILLENQIPFFVLEELFKLIVAEIPEKNKLTLGKYLFEYFGDIMKPKVGKSDSKTKTSCCSSEDQGKKESRRANVCYHILHFLHDNYLPSHDKGGNKKPSGEDLGGLEVSASNLHFAGVKFVSVDGDINLFDVNFREPQGPFWWLCSARFEIPTLDIHDPTEPLLRNLIALEQCCPGVRRYFTSYAKFWDSLISSDDDVKVLKKTRVIRNHLGEDKDVSDLFNKLCNEIVTGKFYFKDDYQRACKYSSYSWPKVRAYWKRTYFASPWKFRAVLVAIIVFGMGLTQFIRSFL